MPSFRVVLAITAAGTFLLACTNSAETPVAPSSAAVSQQVESEAVPIESTGADELRDLLRPGDPSALACIADLGIGPGEFYDKVTDELVFPEETHFFEARYTDGATIEIRIHPDLAADADASSQAERIAGPIGLLPTELRSGIERVGFLAGDAAAQGDGGGEGIHVYERNVSIREAAGRFEETIFHESVHTSIDDLYTNNPDWLAAQAADGAFLTDYASQLPQREDLAETALYAWALTHHPERVSPADADAWNDLVPNRIAFVASILSGPGEGNGTADPTC